MNIEVRKPTEDEITEAQNWPVWEKEASEFPWSYDSTETCLILEGEAEVETSDGKKVSFGEGDLVIFGVGVRCTWKITKPIRKRYNFS